MRMILKVMTGPSTATAVSCLACALLAGCAPADAPDADAAGTSAEVTALVKGTPPGGLEDWIGDITTGLDGLVALAGTDLQSAQRKALDLYVSRQEYIEMYWGEQGRLKPDRMAEALSESVTSAETAFHDVMQTLTSPLPDTTRLKVQLDTLNARMGRVLGVARESGATMLPPGNPPVGEGSAAK